MSFNQKFPGTATVVTSAEPVRGAFTKDGAKLVQDAIRKQNFAGEEWVLGPYKGQMPDKAAMEKGLFDKYSADYIAQWRNVLKKSNVNRYGGLKDASNKLNILTGSTAPLTFEPLPEDDPKQRQPNITKARSVLGWEPKVDLNDGLAATVQYFQSALH